MDDFGNIHGYVNTYLTIQSMLSSLTNRLAVLVACIPALAALLRHGKNAKRPLCNSRGYVKQSSGKEGIDLDTIGTDTQRLGSSGRGMHGNLGRSQDEEYLASIPRTITVTTTVQVSDG